MTQNYTAVMSAGFQVNITGPKSALPKKVFDEFIRKSGKPETDVLSFISKADPKRDLIYRIRGLPELSDQADFIQRSYFANPDETLSAPVGDLQFTDDAKRGIEELISIGLLEEVAATDPFGSSHYRQTEAGRAYPRQVSSSWRASEDTREIYEPVAAEREMEMSM